MKGITRQQLGQGTCPLCSPTRFPVQVDGPDNTDAVYSIVLKKTLVFPCNQGIDHHLRHVLDAYLISVFDKNTPDFPTFAVKNKAFDFDIVNLGQIIGLSTLSKRLDFIINNKISKSAKDKSEDKKIHQPF